MDHFVFVLLSALLHKALRVLQVSYHLLIPLVNGYSLFHHILLDPAHYLGLDGSRGDGIVSDGKEATGF